MQYQMADIAFIEGGELLESPFAGGLNKPQFSSMDFNQDGLNDVFVFDRVGDKAFAFLNIGESDSAAYRHVPEYEQHFPELNKWALARDFNCDGVSDIFTRTGTDQIKVYEGYYEESSLRFVEHTDMLLDEEGEPIFAAFQDLSEFIDVNGDGDIDVLSFEITGDYIMYFENQAQENGLGCAVDYFSLSSWCWGEIEKPVGDIEVLLGTCPDGPPELVSDPDIDLGRQAHPGAALMAFDNDGDGDLDLLLTDQNYGRSNLLINGGDAELAQMISQDSYFPSYNISANVPFFPANFHLDIDGDGNRDLLSAVNGRSYSSESYNCAWYYRNAGTDQAPIFEFVQDDFLVSDMVDVGTKARPVFYDYNQDGLMDLVIGNQRYNNYSSLSIYSQLAIYENTGSADTPEFTLLDRDWQGLSELHLEDMQPAFGDLDLDGDADMLIGDSNGKILFFANDAGNYNLDVTALSISVSSFAAPQLFDLDEDGFLDLLIGDRDGRISYYRNDALEEGFAFSLVTDSLGGIDVDNQFGIAGQAVPFACHYGPEQRLHFFVGSETGQVYQYLVGESILEENYSLIDDDLYFYSDKSMQFSSITIADLNADGYLEIALGNERGGLHILEAKCPYPQAFTAVAVASDSVQLTWSPTGQAEAYYVLYRPLGEEQWQGNFVGDVDSYELGGLLPCTEYELCVTPVCEENLGAQSTVLNVLTAPAEEACPVRVNIRVFLEGPLANGTSMLTQLTEFNQLPQLQPYAVAPWNYQGIEQLSGAAVDVVDWLLVDLLDADFELQERRAVLLSSAGLLLEPDGSLGVRFEQFVEGQQYYIAIRHRNHIDVVSSSRLLLPEDNVYDFTSSPEQARGATLKVSDSGIAALIAGDLNADGLNSYEDFNFYKASAEGPVSYSSKSADLNLDAQVNALDFDLYRSNASRFAVEEGRE